MPNSSCYVILIDMNERNWGGARKGAGRPRGEIVYEDVTIKLPSDEMRILLEAAKRSKLSVSRFVSKNLGLAVAAEFRKKQEAENSAGRN